MTVARQGRAIAATLPIGTGVLTVVADGMHVPHSCGVHLLAFLRPGARHIFALVSEARVVSPGSAGFQPADGRRHDVCSWRSARPR